VLVTGGGGWRSVVGSAPGPVRAEVGAEAAVVGLLGQLGAWSWDALIVYALAGAIAWLAIWQRRRRRLDPDPGPDPWVDESELPAGPDEPELLFRRNASQLRGSGLRERLRAAEAADTAGDTLAWLATNDEPEVRQAVARHPQAPLSTRWELAGDGDWRVRMEVVRAAATPSVLLGSMVADRHPEVATAARTQLAARRDPDGV
jgi:hypothetical protein